MLPSNHSFIKPLVSIIQITYGSFEIYQARADQFSNYGYGAYSLICIPYIIMSFMNLVAALVCPEYPCLFLAESLIMEEARARGCIFNGTIGHGKLDSSDPSSPEEPTQTSNNPPPAVEEKLLVPSVTPGIATTDESVHERSGAQGESTC